MVWENKSMCILVKVLDSQNSTMTSEQFELIFCALSKLNA